MATWINRLREKGRKLVAALIAALIFIALACGWILPPPVYHPSTPPTGAVTYTDLYVDGFIADSANGHDEWTKEGSSPYLNDAEGDNPSNYIHDAGGGHEQGNFTFQDLPSEATSVVNVTLYIRIISYDSASYWIQPYIWNSSSWIECAKQYAGSWTWKSENITDKADWTVNMINDFQVYFDESAYDLGSYGYYYGVDCAYIRVYYQYASVPEVSSVGWSTTDIGQQCVFSSYWTGQDLDKGIFSWNGTGSWVNDTITDPWTGTPDSGWFNVTKTLPDTVGDVVSFRFYVNNSQGWGDSGIYNFTLTYPDYSETQTLKATNVVGLEPHEWIQVLDNAEFKSSSAGWVEHTFSGHYGKYVKFDSIYSEYGADVKGYEVYVQVSGSTWVSPIEVTEYCGGTNINNLIDTDTGTYWEHLTTHAHYFTVKLGAIYSITGVRWYCGGDSSSNITADVWIDRSWYGTGASPYVNDTDYPNNYIQAQGDNVESGNFTFESVSNWDYRWFEHVYLDFKFRKDTASQNLTIYYYYVGYVEPYYVGGNLGFQYQYQYKNKWYSILYSNSSSVNTWTTAEIELSHIWNQTKVNNIKIKVKTQGSGNFKIDYMAIKVKGWALAKRIKFYLDTPNLINWTYNYWGLIFNKQTKTDMENYIDSLADQQKWKDVLIWSARLKKVGIERETAIKYALGNHTKAGELPYSGTDEYGKKRWKCRERDLLYACYYYSQKYNYLTSKWNITKAYNFMHNAISENGTTPPITSGIYEDGTTWDFAERWYDEASQTMSAYLIFYELGVDEALNSAEEVWNYINNNMWNANETHYNYRTDWADYEHCAPFAVKIAAILRWFDPDIGNMSRLELDEYTRFLKDGWNSPQWRDINEHNSTYVPVHHYTSNNERRLTNTVGAWFTLYGIYSQFNSTGKNNIKEMTKDAWYLIYNPWAKLYNSTNKMFKTTSDSSSVSQTATVQALAFQFLVGFSPINTTIAFPLEELNTYYIYDLDPELFGFDYDSRTVKVSIYKAGALRFIYGGVAVEYNFPSNGVFNVTFNDNFTQITNVQKIGDLPSGRKYLYVRATETGVDGDAIIDNNVTFRTKWCSFSAQMNEAFFYWNYTGTMQQNGSLNLSGSTAWSNFTRQLPSTACVIAWYIEANDTDGNWGNTTIQYLTVYAYTSLDTGWNNFTAWSIDVGHTLLDVNASLHSDNINFTTITFEYPNGTEISLVWIQSTDEYYVENTTMTVTSDTTIWIYCKEAGEWYHNYGS